MTLLGRLRRFLGSESGSVTVEAVLVLPILCWAYLGTFAFFDAFRTQSVNVKAAYTIGDVLSRQTDYITPEFLDSLYALQDVLTATEEPTRMRISAVRYTGGKLEVRWSKVRGSGVPELTTSTVDAVSHHVPVAALSDGEVVILTETWMEYAPPFDVGLDKLEFAEVVVTPPRYALRGRFCYHPLNDGGTPSGEVC